jgi:hypothetical protein
MTTELATTEFADFFRLSSGLRAMKIDFDYAKTRKLLEPNWNGYDIPVGHDIIADNVAIEDANVVTSCHQDSALHRIVLDLDNGAAVKPTARDGHEVRLFSATVHTRGTVGGLRIIRTMLNDCQVDVDRKALIIKTFNDLALIPSSTPGHHHLILNVNLTWQDYSTLLSLLEYYYVIERAYLDASLKKGHTCIRVPWVKKQGKTPGATTLGERKGAPGAGLWGKLIGMER